MTDLTSSFLLTLRRTALWFSVCTLVLMDATGYPRLFSPVVLLILVLQLIAAHLWVGQFPVLS